MFRIEAFVDDTKLVSVLYALSGKVKSLDVQPVINVTAKSNGKIEAETSGRLVDLFAKHLSESHGEINSISTKAFLESIGRAPSSYQHVLKQAIIHKLIARHGKGKGMTYKKVDLK
jgi:hypothetical protein